MSIKLQTKEQLYPGLHWLAFPQIFYMLTYCQSKYRQKCSLKFYQGCAQWSIPRTPSASIIMSQYSAVTNYWKYCLMWKIFHISFVNLEGFLMIPNKVQECSHFVQGGLILIIAGTPYISISGPWFHTHTQQLTVNSHVRETTNNCL